MLAKVPKCDSQAHCEVCIEHVPSPRLLVNVKVGELLQQDESHQKKHAQHFKCCFETQKYLFSPDDALALQAESVRQGDSYLHIRANEESMLDQKQHCCQIIAQPNALRKIISVRKVGIMRHAPVVFHIPEN